MVMKMNCWEIKKCGRQTGGDKIGELGICPAAMPGEGKGMHDGKNRGRICWAVSGTFCGGEIQGTFAQKSISCASCEVYSRVIREEDRFKVLLPGQVYRSPIRT